MSSSPLQERNALKVFTLSSIASEALSAESLWYGSQFRDQAESCSVCASNSFELIGESGPIAQHYIYTGVMGEESLFESIFEQKQKAISLANSRPHLLIVNVVNEERPEDLVASGGGLLVPCCSQERQYHFASLLLYSDILASVSLEPSPVQPKEL